MAAGHTMSIHSQNEQVILEFGLKKPAFRIIVNSPTTHGSIGLSTGLDPAMTLGCGGYGGNITSDNISPRHLLNIKRLAYEIRPVANRFEQTGVNAPVAGNRPNGAGIKADALTRRIDEFLASRGLDRSKPAEAQKPEGGVSRSEPAPLVQPSAPAAAVSPPSPVDFVCEDDVKAAMQAGTKIVLAERAIITPSARDLGERHRIFRTLAELR